MQHASIIGLFALISSPCIGCESSDAKAERLELARPSASAQLARVKTEAHETLQAARDYAYAERAEYFAARNQELKELDAETERLSARANKSGAALEASTKAKLAAVREQWKQVKAQLAEAERATEATWDDTKGGFKQAYGELQGAVDQARQDLSDEIEP